MDEIDYLHPPQHAQRQDALNDQLKDLHALAAKLGMYDAADWLWHQMPATITGKSRD